MHDQSTHNPPRWVKRFGIVVGVVLPLFMLHLVVMWSLGHPLGEMVGHRPPSQ